MQIKDRIYGEFEIVEPVILELLESKPMIRLKGISQFGIPDKYYFRKGFSRYEHSVGVMLLLKKLGATTKEQVAGLLHDVSHTAFSHIVDWVLGQGTTENFQDDRHNEVMNGLEISKILKKYGYNPNEISNLSSYKLLDTEIPELCADRIDYALRQFTIDDATRLIPKITQKEGKIIFTDVTSALDFANLFLEEQITNWAGFEGSSRYMIFTEILKKALDSKIIEFDDFYGDESPILDKLENCDDQFIKKWLTMLTAKSISNLPLGSQRVVKKFRYVDPSFMTDNKIILVSDVFPKWKAKVVTERRKNEEGIRIVDME